jgi:hypothetical protein
LRGRDDKKEEKIKEKEEKQKRRSESKDAAVAGAVLGDVAEKVKHDREEPAATPAAIEAEEERKHRSLLAKLKGGDKEGRHSKDDDDKLTKAEKKELAAAAAAGATLDEVANKVKQSLDEPVSPVSPIETEEQRKHKSLLAKLNEKKEDHDAAKAEKAEIKEHEKAEKQAEKEAHKYEKQAENEAHKHEKEAEKEAQKHEEQAEKEAHKHQKEAAKAGATLEEVAEKVKHNLEEPKLADESAVEPKSRSHVGAATAAGVAGGAAGAAAIAHAATDKDETSAPANAGESEFLPVAPVEEGPAPTAVATDEKSEFLPVAQVDPTQPATESKPATTTSAATSVPAVAEPEGEKSDAIPFQQQGSLSRYSNDAVPTLGTARPDLERHISQIPETDDDEDDEEVDLVAAVALTTEPLPETVEQPQTRAGKVAAAIAKGVAPMAASFGPAVPYHESAAVREDDEKAAAQVKAVDDKVVNVLADNTAPLASAFAPVAAVKPTHAADDVTDPREEQRYTPEETKAGPTVVGSGGSIAKVESSRPGTADTVTPANAGESDKSEKKGLKGFFSKLKPKGKDSSEKEKEKLPEFKTVAKKDKEAKPVVAPAVAPVKTSSDEKAAPVTAAPEAAPVKTSSDEKTAAPAVVPTSTAAAPAKTSSDEKTAPLAAAPVSAAAVPASTPSGGNAAPVAAAPASTVAAPARKSLDGKIAAVSAIPTSVGATTDPTNRHSATLGAITNWQTAQPELPANQLAYSTASPLHGTVNPPTVVNANTAAPVTATSSANTAAPATTVVAPAASTAPASTAAAADLTNKSAVAPGTITNWQTVQPELPAHLVHGSANATDPTPVKTAAPAPITSSSKAAAAAPATTSAAAAHDEHTDDEDHPSRTSRIAAALGLKPKQERNKLHKRSLDEQRNSSIADETEDDEENFYDADQGVTPTTGAPPASVFTGAATDSRKETKFTENL